MKKTIILISGNAGAGKDTVFGMIKDFIPEICQYTFAASLKNIVKDLSKLFLNADFDAYQMNLLEYKEQLRPELTIYDESGPRPLSIRYLLQNVGTEIIRNHLGEDVFVNSVISQIESHPDQRIVAVTDLRFPNELLGMKKFCSRKGYALVVVKVKRPDVQEVNHSSEKNINKLSSDWVIENDQGLDELRDQVWELVRYYLWSFVGHMVVTTLSS